MTPQDSTLRTFHRTAPALRLLTSSQLVLDVQGFLLDRKARNLSPGTLRYYRQKLYPLVSYLEDLGVCQVEGVTPGLLRQWLVHLQEAGHNAGGVHGFYRAAKAFFSWLTEEGALAESPMRRVKSPRVPQEPLDPVTITQVRAMLDVCDTKTELGARDRAVVLCLLDTGCRASEFTALTCDDVDLATSAVLVRSGKGRKPRVTFLGTKSRRQLLRYLRYRGDLPASAPLFANEIGGPLSYTGLRDIIRRRAMDTGIEAPTLHSFRRAFGLGMLRNGADVYSLQKMMGHCEPQRLEALLGPDRRRPAAGA